MKQESILTDLAAVSIVTILCALIYVTVQQSYRLAANDPQLQIAGDISDKLKKAEPVDKWFQGDTCDIARSLSVFQTLYNEQTQPVLSTGFLHGMLLSLPAGVFDLAREKGENAFTWQPERGVRVAIVLRPVQSPSYSFIAVGRSLYEIEKREKNLLGMAFAGWAFCMGIIILHRLINSLLIRKISNN